MQTPRIRTSNKQDLLPSARLVSNALFDGYTPTSAIHTTFLTHFGQFIDHDVISTPTMTVPSKNTSSLKDRGQFP